MDNGNGRPVHYVSESSDKKVGPVPVSYSPPSTCPDSCSLKTGGCYAWEVFYMRRLGRLVESGEYRRSLVDALKARRADARIVRHRVAGDVVGDVSATVEDCNTVTEYGLTNIGYTHTWAMPESAPLRSLFRASCDNESQAAEAHRQGWGTTIVIPEDAPIPAMVGGKRAVHCPAQRTDGKVNCNACTLCRIDDKTRETVVVFTIHGNASGKRKANAAIAAASAPSFDV